jgi:hypothetical protein
MGLELRAIQFLYFATIVQKIVDLPRDFSSNMLLM